MPGGGVAPVAHYEELRELQQHYLHEALRHSKTIAETAPADPDRAGAGAGFVAARDKQRAFARKAGQQQNAAGQARARLAADDQSRRELGPVISDGDRAGSALRAGARGHHQQRGGTPRVAACLVHYVRRLRATVP